MADVLMIAGKPETVFTARDFEYLVEKHMGYEAAKYFREYLKSTWVMKRPSISGNTLKRLMKK